MLVGEHLNEDEAGMGRAFEGSGGWQLNHVLKRAGLRREDFNAMDTVLKCRPPHGKLNWTGEAQSAIRHCSPYLDETIAAVQPKAIVAMGGIALSRLTGLTGIQRHRGFLFETAGGIPVVGTFHPDFLLPKRGEKSAAKYTWVMIMDIRKALRVAQGRLQMFPQHYLLDPSPDVAAGFMAEGMQMVGATMAWDLETLYKLKEKNEQKQKLDINQKQVITRISFAFRQGYAMTIPWTAAYLEKVIVPFFRSTMPKVGWNSRGFDEPIIRLQEKMEMNGRLYDGMDTFHVFQPNIERNLEFATSLLTDHLKPWKHTSQSEPEYYSAQDSDATISNFLQLRAMMQAIQVPEYANLRL